MSDKEITIDARRTLRAEDKIFSWMHEDKNKDTSNNNPIHFNHEYFIWIKYKIRKTREKNDQKKRKERILFFFYSNKLTNTLKNDKWSNMKLLVFLYLKYEGI